MLYKSIFYTLALLISTQLPLAAQLPEKPFVSEVWSADLGNGRYKNPVLHADYSDPDAIRAGEYFYMTASSFQCTPGLPILRSKDLVNWTIVGHALQQQYPLEHYQVPRHGDGCWAPCIRFHKGTFYIYWGDPDFGIYMVKTQNPAGEWEPPVLVMAGKGMIDPSPFWDTDGKAWLVHGWAGSRAGVNALLTVHRMSPDGTRLLDAGRHVFDGHDAHPTVEGPKFYKRNGFYYIFAPAGGVATGWQLVLRSRNIYGPYEEKIVLEQGKSDVNGPHQGAWVQTATGESWFLHFQDKEAYGRILHLQPMQWKDNWPVMGIDQDGNGIGEPVAGYKKPVAGMPVTTPADSDEFDGPALGLQWQWHANPAVTWSALLPGKGFLRLFTLPQSGNNLWMTPQLLLQKFPALEFTATTRVEWNVDSVSRDGKRAGLIVMGDDYACLQITSDAEGCKISQTVCKKAKNDTAEETTWEQRIPGNVAFFRVRVSGPDGLCQFSTSTDGTTFTPVGTPFQAKPDTWIGAKVGLFCSRTSTKRGGYADFDWFRITR